MRRREKSEAKPSQLGRIVRYVLDENQIRAGEIRPALVTRETDDGLLNLFVFLDGTNDGRSDGGAAMHAYSVARDEGHSQGTWHDGEPS